jgi:hypothetical protein
MTVQSIRRQEHFRTVGVRAYQLTQREDEEALTRAITELAPTPTIDRQK